MSASFAHSNAALPFYGAGPREVRCSSSPVRKAMPAAHHLLLIEEFEALASGETDFLLVEMPLV